MIQLTKPALIAAGAGAVAVAAIAFATLRLVGVDLFGSSPVQVAGSADPRAASPVTASGPVAPVEATPQTSPAQQTPGPSAAPPSAPPAASAAGPAAPQGAAGASSSPGAAPVASAASPAPVASAAPPAPALSAAAPAKPAPAPQGVASAPPESRSAAPASASEPQPSNAQQPVQRQAAAPPVAPSPRASSAPASAPAAAPVAPQRAATPASPGPAAGEATKAKPTFDVVRVDPAGDTVVAGRAAPKSRVALLVSGKPLAEVVADDAGQFVMLPPALPPGNHVLALRSAGEGGDLVSDQRVDVAVPERGGKAAVAALVAPGKPTVVLSAPAAPASAGPAPEVRIASAEALQGGAFFMSGVAPAGSNLRLYLNDSFVASVGSGPDGRWSVRVERGMTPGAYRLRADKIDATGRTTARAEAPFDYPAEAVAPVVARLQTPGEGAQTSPPQTKPSQASQPQPGQSRAGQSPAAAPAPAPSTEAQGSAPAAVASAQAPPASDPEAHAVVDELRTAKVVRGDSLWRISRNIYGEGIRYTQIYDANTSQIRNPDLIYPGQILVVPKQEPPAPPR